MPTNCGIGSVAPLLLDASARGDIKTYDHVMREQVKEFLPSQIETYYDQAAGRPFLNADIYPTKIFDYKKAVHENGVMRTARYTTTAFTSVDEINNTAFQQWEKAPDCSELGIDGVQANYCNRAIPTITFRTGLTYYDAMLAESRIVSPIICLDFIKQIQDFDNYLQALTRDMIERPIEHRENHFRALVYKNSRSVILSEQFFKTFQFTGTGLPTTLGNVNIVNPQFAGWEAIFNLLKKEQGIDGCVYRNGMRYLLMIISQQTFENMKRVDPKFTSNSTLAGRDIVPYFGRFMQGYKEEQLFTYGPFIVMIDDNVPRAHIVTDPATGLDVLQYVAPWDNVLTSTKYGAGTGYTKAANVDWHTAPLEPVLITGLNAFMRTVNDPDAEVWANYISGTGFNAGDPWQEALQRGTATFEWVNTNPLPSYIEPDPCKRENVDGKKGAFVATVRQGIEMKNPLRSSLFLVPTQIQACASMFYIPADICVRGKVAEPKCENRVMIEPVCDPCANGSILYITATKLKADVCSDNPQITITLTRQTCFSGVASIQYATSDGTAIAGTDYTATTGTLTWADGEGGSKTITIPVLNNPLVNQNGFSFNITLTPGPNTVLEPECNQLLAVLEQPCFPCEGDEEDNDDDDDDSNIIPL